MRRAGVIAGLLVALGGAVWVLQGLDVAFAPRSFMTGYRSWVLYGALTIFVGLAIAGWSSRRG